VASAVAAAGGFVAGGIGGIFGIEVGADGTEAEFETVGVSDRQAEARVVEPMGAEVVDKRTPAVVVGEGFDVENLEGPVVVSEDLQEEFEAGVGLGAAGGEVGEVGSGRSAQERGAGGGIEGVGVEERENLAEFGSAGGGEEDSVAARMRPLGGEAAGQAGISAVADEVGAGHG
jgi:hypothetical protein